MERHEQRHPRTAEATVDGHLLSRCNGEGYCLRIAVEEIDVARAAGKRARRMNAIADVLHAVWRIARDDLSRRLVVKAERRNPVVLSVKQPRLAVGSR